jgi:hypothetical protein
MGNGTPCCCCCCWWWCWWRCWHALACDWLCIQLSASPVSSVYCVNFSCCCCKYAGPKAAACAS